MDCLGLAIEGRLFHGGSIDAEAMGNDFARVSDPIKMTDFDEFFLAQYNTITDSKWEFGFTRRELHHFVSMADGALERIKTAAFTSALPGGGALDINGNELVERYARFWKGAAWVGMATKDASEPVVFFLMHKAAGQLPVSLKPQFKVNEPSRVKVDTLKKIGFNACNASLNSRAQYTARLDVVGALPKEVDQRNAPFAPVSRTPHRQPEWFAFASRGICHAVCQGKSLPEGWSAHARSPH